MDTKTVRQHLITVFEYMQKCPYIDGRKYIEDYVDHDHCIYYKHSDKYKDNIFYFSSMNAFIYDIYINTV